MTDVEKCGGALWKPNRKVYTHCLRCGRKLKSDEAQLLGYGRVCFKKAKLDCQEKLF